MTWQSYNAIRYTVSRICSISCLEFSVNHSS
jgi:hypothetical protein